MMIEVTTIVGGWTLLRTSIRPLSVVRCGHIPPKPHFPAYPGMEMHWNSRLYYEHSAILSRDLMLSKNQIKSGVKRELFRRTWDGLSIDGRPSQFHPTPSGRWCVQVKPRTVLVGASGTICIVYALVCSEYKARGNIHKIHNRPPLIYLGQPVKPAECRYALSHEWVLS